VGSFSDEVLSAWLGERFVLDLRTRVFDHLHRLSVDFFDRRQLGDTLSRLTSDIDAIEALVLSGVTRTLSYAAEIVLFTGALFYLNWQLALASMLAAPAFALGARYFSARIKDASREQRRRSGSVTAVAEESLGNTALVQAYHRRAAETQRFHRENLGRFAAEMAATRLEALFRPLVEMLEVVGVVLVVGVGVWLLQRDQITLGGLLVFVTYLTRLYSPIRGTGRLSNTVYAASASAERIIDLLSHQPDVRDPADPRPLPPNQAAGSVVFDAVTFTYPGPPSTRSVSRRDRARRSRSSARAGPESPRLASCCCGSTTRTAATSLLTGATCGTWVWPACGATWQWCCRKRWSLTEPSATTFCGANRMPPTPKWSPRPPRRTPTSSSAPCPTATTPGSDNVAGCCRGVNASGWPSPEP
jgi:ABC-type multidrug transport system fused ATPase/permease subunit